MRQTEYPNLMESEGEPPPLSRAGHEYTDTCGYTRTRKYLYPRVRVFFVLVLPSIYTESTSTGFGEQILASTVLVGMYSQVLTSICNKVLPWGSLRM